MYRAGTESILGLRRRGETFVIDPCIPSSWPEYQISWRYLDSRYAITVSNPARRCRGVARATLDGAPVDAAAIPLVNDGRTHDVQIVLGDPAALPIGLTSRGAGLSTAFAGSTR
jgi:cyclic beta-1,2-glucan synthetase